MTKTKQHGDKMMTCPACGHKRLTFIGAHGKTWRAHAMPATFGNDDYTGGYCPNSNQPVDFISIVWTDTSTDTGSTK